MGEEYSLCGSIKVRERNEDVDELLRYARENNEGNEEEECYFDDDTMTLHFNTGGIVTIHFRGNIHELLEKVGKVAEPCMVYSRCGSEGDGIVAVGPDEESRAQALSAHYTDEFLIRIANGNITLQDMERVLKRMQKPL